MSKINIPEDFSLEKIEVPQDWFTEREKTLQKARVFTGEISSSEENAQAASVLKEITKTIKDASSCRLEITRPLDQIKKSIMAAYKDAEAPLLTAQNWIKGKMVAFAKAEEAKRIEERKKFEAEQAEKVEQQFAEHLQNNPETEFVPVVEDLKVSKPAEKTIDSVVTKSLQFEIVDPNELPRQFLKPDETAIRKTLQELKKYYMEKCEESQGCVYISKGLKIFIETSVKSR